MLLRNKTLLMAVLNKGYYNEVSNGNFAYGKRGWTVLKRCQWEVENNAISLTGDWVSSGAGIYQGTDIEYVPGKKLYYHFKVKPKNNLVKYLSLTIANFSWDNHKEIKMSDTFVADTTYILSGIFTFPSGWTVEPIDYFPIVGYESAEAGYNQTAEISEVILIDLDKLNLQNRDVEWCNANIPPNIIWTYNPEKIYIDNVLNGGDFEADNNSDGVANYWMNDASGATINLDNTIKYHNVFSQKAQSAQKFGLYQYKYTEPSHIYYASTYFYLSSYTSGYYPAIFVGSSDLTNFDDGNFVTTLNQWELSSVLFNGKGDSVFCVGYDEGEVYTVNIDCAILIDLTAEFGAGNEPTKEWCDNNISAMIPDAQWDYVW